MLVPDTAHGTNPASCTLNGYTAVPIASSADGILDPVTVAEAMDDRVQLFVGYAPGNYFLEFDTFLAKPENEKLISQLAAVRIAE